jgi:hypothetical protein
MAGQPHGGPFATPKRCSARRAFGEAFYDTHKLGIFGLSDGKPRIR